MITSLPYTSYSTTTPAQWLGSLIIDAISELAKAFFQKLAEPFSSTQPTPIAQSAEQSPAAPTPPALTAIQEQTIDALSQNSITTDTQTILGKGGTATVYEGIKDGKPVAIKCMKKATEPFNPNEGESLILNKEIADMQKVMALILYDTNTSSFHHIDNLKQAPKSDSLFIVATVSEKLGGSLENQEKNLSEDQIKDIALQSATFLKNLHSLNIVHGDFNSGSILLDEEKRITVIDFGLAAASEDNDDKRSDYVQLLSTFSTILGFKRESDKEKFNALKNNREAAQNTLHQLDPNTIDEAKLIDLLFSEKLEQNPNFLNTSAEEE